MLRAKEALTARPALWGAGTAEGLTGPGKWSLSLHLLLVPLLLAQKA